MRSCCLSLFCVQERQSRQRPSNKRVVGKERGRGRGQQRRLTWRRHTDQETPTTGYKRCTLLPLYMHATPGVSHEVLDIIFLLGKGRFLMYCRVLNLIETAKTHGELIMGITGLRVRFYGDSLVSLSFVLWGNERSET